MFGHTDNQQVTNTDQPTADPAAANDQIMHDGSLEEPSTVPGGDISGGLGEIPAAPPVAQPVNDNPFALPTTPAPEPTATTLPPSAPAPNAKSDDLLDLKQKALEQLSPLVGHLEQSPEEKFKTTMMMIQASDDQSLLPEAYEAAQAISDEKAKAQALLDVVNEINYFTQSH
jgi:hypothetical protein